jgi:hypothetical protein
MTNTRPTPRHRPTRLLQLAAVVTVSAGLAYAGSAAFATPAPHFKLRPLATVFSVLRHAHPADAGSLPREAIGGATSTVQAGTFPTGDSVYVAKLESGDICLVDQEPPAPNGAAPNDTSGLIAVACSHPAQAEQTGTGLLEPSVNGSAARITLLVPNGVRSVAFGDADGTMTTQTVVNNVAQKAAPNLTSASFTTPSGQQATETVPTDAGSQ